MPVTQKWVHGGVFLTAIVLVVCVSVLVLGAIRQSNSDAGLPGAVAPAFVLKNGAGETISSRAYNDKVTLVVFGGRRDQHFAAVAPMIESLVQTYAGDPSVAVVGLQYDASQSVMGREDHAPGVLQLTLPDVPVLLDTDAAAARAYRVSDEPTAFVIDRRGVIRHRVPLTNESSRVLCSEAINALRTAADPITGRPMLGN